MKKAILVGIGGASGSGKTLVAKRLAGNFGSEKAVIIQEDSYYKDLSDMPPDKRAAVNFDHPDAFDYDLLAEDIAKLLKGDAISHPIYDYENHTRTTETRIVGPGEVIILEGILVLNNDRLREVMDLRVFVDTPLDICLVRRLKRDINERGRTADSVIRQYEQTVRPMYFEFIEPSMKYADVFIKEGGKNESAIFDLAERIKAMPGDNIN